MSATEAPAASDSFAGFAASESMPWRKTCFAKASTESPRAAAADSNAANSAAERFTAAEGSSE